MADRITAHWERVGFGLWAVEVPGITPFAGFVGLAIPRSEAQFTPSVEIGWRLDATCWGRGYATEGARAALRFGFEPLGLDEIVSFTFAGNFRSRRVMEKIGVTHSPSEDFDHPGAPRRASTAPARLVPIGASPGVQSRIVAARADNVKAVVPVPTQGTHRPGQRRHHTATARGQEQQPVIIDPSPSDGMARTGRRLSWKIRNPQSFFLGQVRPRRVECGLYHRHQLPSDPVGQVQPAARRVRISTKVRAARPVVAVFGGWGASWRKPRQSIRPSPPDSA
jgi:hypothetical protein